VQEILPNILTLPLQAANSDGMGVFVLLCSVAAGRAERRMHELGFLQVPTRKEGWKFSTGSPRLCSWRSNFDLQEQSLTEKQKEKKKC
jgi:hypothetical protein